MSTPQTQSQRIRAAYDVLEELGWRHATAAEGQDLPLGTPEQRCTVRAALDRGGWDEWQAAGLRHLKNAPEHPGVAALYAARAGAPQRRVAELLEYLGWDGDAWDACADVAAARGVGTELEFIGGFWGDLSRGSTNGASYLSASILTRVAARGLPLPESVEYTKDFWAHAASRIGAAAALPPWELVFDPVGEDVLRPRFAEHLALTARLGAPVTGPAAVALTAATENGWVGRKDVLDAAVLGLDAAGRPGDRKVWAGLIAGPVAATGPDLAARFDELIPLLSLGEAPLAEAVGAPLLAEVREDRLAELTLALSSVGTAKTRRAVLSALRARPVPAAAVAADAFAALEHWADKPGPVAKALHALRVAWDVPEDAVEADAGDPAPYAWPATPAVWKVPRVDFGEASEAALALAAGALLRGERYIVDLAVERFLALAVELARTDPDAVRRVAASTGSVHEYRPGLDDLARWAIFGRTVTDRASDSLAVRRTSHVSGRLGEVPVVLSAPSWEDLRVDAADLAARLETLAAEGLPALDSDLVLALTRLEPASATPETSARLARLSVPVKAFNGPLRPGAEAGAAVLAYLDDPVLEPTITPAAVFKDWRRGDVTVPASLRFTPVRPQVTDGSWTGEGFSTFPTWGDTVGKEACSGWYSAAEDTGPAVWEQLARRERPLTPGLAVNLLAGLRRKDHVARAEHFASARLAWERGLLRPGVADLAFIDWEGTPTQLAALAEAWLEAAEDGLLPVVWPLLEALCVWAEGPGRPPAGLADVAAAMARLAPSVAAAVEQEKAPAEAADVPGLRALAARKGSAQAVASAREAVAALPERASVSLAAQAPGAGAPAALSAEGFGAAWPAGLPDPAVVEDGVLVTPRKLPRPESKAGLVFDLLLPGTQRAWRADKWMWVYDLYSSRTCHVHGLRSSGAPNTEERHWLMWDEESAALTLRDFPAAKENSEVLSSGLAAVAVGLLGQDGEGGASGRLALEVLLREGYLGEARVRDAVRALLPHADAVSPARLAAATTKVHGFLPALWPLLTEPIAYAARLEGAPPRWLAPVLTTALVQAPLLREAGARGLIPGRWEGLEELAERPGKVAALLRARELREALHGPAS